MTDEKVNARELALGILMKVTEESSFVHVVLRHTLSQYQYLEKQDRAFITRLCEGTIERLITIDYTLNHYSSVKVNKMKPFIRNLLRMSVYQISYMEQVPASAACNEAVKLSKKRGFQNLSGFVNGILRNISRNGEPPYPTEEKDPLSFLSVAYSVPLWLVSELEKQYGYLVVKGMLQAYLEEKKTVIRCNRERISVEELTKILRDSQVSVLPGDYLPYALKISDYNYLDQLETFQKGYFQVQDESSMLVGAVCGVKEGDYVMDLCAAPGGKTLHIAEELKSTGLVSARDISEKKTALILENIKRMGSANVSVKVWDALVFDEDSAGKADIVIADLPCSGLGVIGKKPDIKYNMTKEKLQELAALQREILKVAGRYVKEGGVLIYSTCTVNQKENIENAKWFAAHSGFRLEGLDNYLPKSLQSPQTKEGFLQLVPGIHTTDGFFLARLRKE